MNKIKRIWYKALGNKASDCDRESDFVGLVRTIIFITYFVTNVTIICGVVRHWDDSNQKEVLQHLGT